MLNQVGTWFYILMGTEYFDCLVQYRERMSQCEVMAELVHVDKLTLAQPDVIIEYSDEGFK